MYLKMRKTTLEQYVGNYHKTKLHPSITESEQKHPNKGDQGIQSVAMVTNGIKKKKSFFLFFFRSHQLKYRELFALLHHTDSKSFTFAPEEQ